MTTCTGGRFCPGCHPRRAIALLVGWIAAYIGFLAVVFWWMP